MHQGQALHTLNSHVLDKMREKKKKTTKKTHSGSFPASLWPRSVDLLQLVPQVAQV